MISYRVEFGWWCFAFHNWWWKTANFTHASRLVRSSQNFSQNVDLFFILSTLVLSVRGSVPPPLPAATPVDMLCSDAELLAINVTPAPAPPSLSDWDPDRCMTAAVSLSTSTDSLHNTLSRTITLLIDLPRTDRHRPDVAPSPTLCPRRSPLMTVVIVDYSKMTLSLAII